VTAPTAIADYPERIRQARVSGAAIVSPLDRAPRLSQRLGNEIFLKREDVQPVFSFKLRGACNKLANMAPEDRERGVICSSAGNHAQGLALAAGRLGTRAVIVMPMTTPSIKVEAVRALGGEVILHGGSYDDAQTKALELAARENLAFVHPFNDPEVIAGQGTIALELESQCDDAPQAIFVPIGGGGLIAGIAAYAKQCFPETKIIGVEPEDCASMHAALAAGEPVTLEHVGIFADGVAVRRVGDETFRICQACVDEIVLVETDEICAAIQDIFEDTRAIMEPAGALAVAGLKKFVEQLERRGENYVAINAGANMNFNRLRHVAERAAIGEQREALIGVEIPEEKGSFLAFCRAVGKMNVTEFNYRLADPDRAHIFVGIELSGGIAERMEIIERLRASGYRVLDMADNELAKLHIRHTVGGLAPGLANERIFRFEFPERPGALLDFLEAIGNRWNISLFHYRNHGSDFGRVLAGIQVPDAEQPELEHHIGALGYEHADETANPAYRMFLAE